MNENNNRKLTCVGECVADVGRRIASARKEEKLSQRQLADIIGKSTNTINRFEKSRRSPDIEEITLIGEALNREPCWLLIGKKCLEPERSEVGTPVLLTGSEDGSERLQVVVPGIKVGDSVAQMEGNEMSPRIQHGDLLVIRNVDTEPGDIVSIVDEWNGRHVRWQREVDGQMVFVAENQGYPPLSGSKIKITGKIHASIHVDKY